MDSLPKHELSERHNTDIMKILESQNSELKNCIKTSILKNQLQML